MFCKFINFIKGFFTPLQPKIPQPAIGSATNPIQVTPKAPVVPEPQQTVDDYPWIREAKKYIGEKEISGSNDNPIIVNFYYMVMGKKEHDEVAWCAAFVNAILKASGQKYLKTLWAADMEEYGTPCELKPGCVATKYSSAANSKRHTFFVYSVDKKKGNLIALGGNQNNSVCFETILISDLRSTRWPINS